MLRVLRVVVVALLMIAPVGAVRGDEDARDEGEPRTERDGERERERERERNEETRDRADASSSKILEALADPDFAVRERAMRALLADHELSDEQLAELYRRATTAEQRNRLLTVAMHHQMRQKAQDETEFPAPTQNQAWPGAVGIPQHAVRADQLPQIDRSAVRIWRTFPGFPAHEAFKRDDLIIAVEGRPLPRTNLVSETFTQFRNMLVRFQAGESVTLTVLRDDQQMEIEVELANSDALSKIYGGREGMINQRSPRYSDHWDQVRDEYFGGPTAIEDKPLVIDWP